MAIIPWFTRDVEDALTIIGTRAPECAHEIAQFRKALANDSRMLPRRFKVLLGNALGGAGRPEFTQEEKQELGELLVRLEEYFQTGKPGPRLRGNEYRLMVYLTNDENEALLAYCDEHHVSRAAAVRAGLRALRKAP